MFILQSCSHKNNGEYSMVLSKQAENKLAPPMGNGTTPYKVGTTMFMVVHD
jgi:hypothetical protein